MIHLARSNRHLCVSFSALLVQIWRLIGDRFKISTNLDTFIFGGEHIFCKKILIVCLFLKFAAALVANPIRPFTARILRIFVMS